MDDRELDRLFGNDSDSDKETPGKDNGVSESKYDKNRQDVHGKKKSGPKPGEKKVTPGKPSENRGADRKAAEKKPSDNSDTGKKGSEKKGPEKKGPLKKEPGKKEPDKKETDRKESDKKESGKTESDKKTPEPSAAEKNGSGKEPVNEAEDKGLPEENGENDKSSGDEPDAGKETKAEDTEETEETEENKDSEDADESSGEDGEEDGDGSVGEDDEEDGSAGEDLDADKESPEKEHKSRKPSGSKNGTGQKRRPEKASDDDSLIRQIRETIPLNGKSILAIGLAFALVVMVVLVLFLPAFRVRNTNVEGNVVLTDQEILKAVGLEYDAHLMSGVSGNILDILRLDYGKTEQRIKSENPYVEDIRITIKLPSTVDIKVKERSKVCYIRTPDGYAALDKDGIVLELSSFDSHRTVRPVICGLNVKYAELGKPVKIENMNDYKKSIIVLGAILAADNASVGGDYSMFENTSEVRILPSGNIFLTIYSPSGNLMQIKLNGTDSIGDNMAWLLYAFNADAFDKVTVPGALDMTGEEFVFDEYD